MKKYYFRFCNKASIMYDALNVKRSDSLQMRYVKAALRIFFKFPMCMIILGICELLKQCVYCMNEAKEVCTKGWGDNDYR